MPAPFTTYLQDSTDQLPATPDQKGQNQKDKEARGEQLATGMRSWRKVKAIVHVGAISGIRPAA